MSSKKNASSVEVNVVLLIDDSGSMQSYVSAARDLIGKQVSEIAGMKNAKRFSLIEFGSEINVKLSFVSPKKAKTSVPHYNPHQGSTRVIDAMVESIDHLEKAPQSENSAYLLMTITDGEDNASHRSRAELKRQIEKLTSTDKWTFMFNGVGRYAREFAKSVGIPEGNFLEFEASDAGVRRLAATNVQATLGLSERYSRGETASRGVYVNLAGVNTQEVKDELNDVTSQYHIVDVDQDSPINEFVRSKLGLEFQRGRGFYELSKPEEVQDYKDFLIQDKTTGKLFGGPTARKLLGLNGSDQKVKPGHLGKWRVFVLSTSNNRKLVAGTKFVYAKQPQPAKA